MFVRYNLEVLQNRLNSAVAASASLQEGATAYTSTSTSAVSGVPRSLVPQAAISPCDTFKVRNVTGLVSQAMQEVSRLRMNQNNLQHLRQLYANSPMVPRVHQEQTQRLDMVIRQAVLNLHGKIQLVNDAITRFQSSPLVMHPAYSNEVNKHRQILYNALEELRRNAPTTAATNTSMHPATSNAPIAPGAGARGGAVWVGTGQAQVTSTTDHV